MRLRLIGSLAAAVLVGIAAACGGASSTGLFDNSDAGGSADGSASSDGSTRADGSPATDGAATNDSGGGSSGSNPGVVSCGDTTCARTGALRQICCYTPNGAACQPEQLNTCTGHRLQCDEKKDCEGANVCCAELLDGDRIQTRCLATCTTGAPRYQVCKTNDECESGSCKAYDCRDGVPDLKFCQRPPDCK